MDTNSDVLNYGRRVNHYIRSLHDIIIDARRNLAKPDSFPWEEWAAYLAQWDQYFYDEIEHGFFLWFAEDTIREYHEQAKGWERIIARAYRKTPRGPGPLVHGDSSSVATYGVLGAASVLALLLWRSKR